MEPISEPISEPIPIVKFIDWPGLQGYGLSPGAKIGVSWVCQNPQLSETPKGKRRGLITQVGKMEEDGFKQSCPQ